MTAAADGPPVCRQTGAAMKWLKLALPLAALAGAVALAAPALHLV